LVEIRVGGEEKIESQGFFFFLFLFPFLTTGLSQLSQGGMGMGGFGQSLGQLGQQSSGSLGSSLGLGNGGQLISSPSQTVYQASYGLNSLGKW
jgi:hypothetical protein